MQETWFDPWIGKIPWRRAWQPTPVFLPGESHGQRSLTGYCPWGLKESNTTEWLSAQHVIWEGFLGGSVVKNPPANTGDAGSIPGSGRSHGKRNGNPLQYSCLGNVMDKGDYSPRGHNLANKQQFVIWKETILTLSFILYSCPTLWTFKRLFPNWLKWYNPRDPGHSWPCHWIWSSWLTVISIFSQYYENKWNR